MTTKTAVILPDTNLFIQCHPLKDLNWSSFSEYDELRLLICRSVQRELDGLKTRGNSRVKKRVRQILRIIEPLITGAEDYVEVKKSSPTVRIHLAAPGLPSQELLDTLDYNKPDDELVGYAHRYRTEFSESDVLLLTRDTGPMMTARSLGLQYRGIPDDWLIDLQMSPESEENARLKAQITEMQRKEPRFELQFIGDNDDGITAIECLCTVYEPLSREDVDTSMQRIQHLFPRQTDFGPTEPAERNTTIPFGSSIRIKQIYEPAAEQEIEHYREVDYPNWIAECESLLRNLHSDLQSQTAQPHFMLAASNVGSRPARDALIEITAKGGLQVCVEPYREPEEPVDHTDTSAGFARPPQAPSGKWIGPLERLGSMLGDVHSFEHLRRSIMTPLPVAPLLSSHLTDDLSSIRRDPNGFYYKPTRPTDPADSICLECDQWRHGTDTELFEGLLCFDITRAEIDGALECQIHAENLSSPVHLTVPVRIRTTKTSTKPVALAMLRRLQEIAQ